MEKPKFSVIIPALNEEKFLPKLLASLTLQTNRNFEVIVVDGSSKDRTVAVAKKYSSKLPALTVEVSLHPSLPLQRNIGARKARGEWFVFVDADSILFPYFIERVDRYIREEKPELFTTWFRPDSEKTADALVTLLANMTIESSMTIKRPFAPGPLTIVAREVFERVGGYDEELTFGEDMDFSRRVVERGYTLKILRDTLCVWSLRRFRKEGKLKVMQAYAKAVFSVLFTKKAPRQMSGYIMGGHLYTQKTKIPFEKSVIKGVGLRFKKLMQEITN